MTLFEGPSIGLCYNYQYESGWGLIIPQFSIGDEIAKIAVASSNPVHIWIAWGMMTELTEWKI